MISEGRSTLNELIFLKVLVLLQKKILEIWACLDITEKKKINIFSSENANKSIAYNLSLKHLHPPSFFLTKSGERPTSKVFGGEQVSLLSLVFQILICKSYIYLISLTNKRMYFDFYPRERTFVCPMSLTSLLLK